MTLKMEIFPLSCRIHPDIETIEYQKTTQILTIGLREWNENGERGTVG